MAVKANTLGGRLADVVARGASSHRPLCGHYERIIVGAGPAGLVLALLYAQQGQRSMVLEKRMAPRHPCEASGRNINFSVNGRGLRVLGRLGLRDAILAEGVVLPTRVVHHRGGRVADQPYGDGSLEESLISIPREVLIRVLFSAAEQNPHIELQCGASVLEISSLEDAALRVKTPDGAEIQVSTDLLVGADGAYSTVRGAMERRIGFSFARHFAPYGFKELTIPPERAPGEKGLHVWPGGRSVVVGLPNRDGSVAVSVFAPLEGPDGLDALDTPGRVGAFFQRMFPEVAERVPRLAEQFLQNPAGRMISIRCARWSHGRAVLIGDSAHAILPFLGAGMNAALEDAAALVDAFESTSSQAEALRAFEIARRQHLEVLGDLAHGQLTKLSETCASSFYSLLHAAENWIHRAFPTWYRTLYQLVAFSAIPYADVVALARRRKRRALASVALFVVILVTLAVLAIVRPQENLL